MILSTMNDLPGYGVTEVLGEMGGEAVLALRFGASEFRYSM